MSRNGHYRLLWRTATDALIGLVLFMMFVTAVGAIERAAAAKHRLGEILAASSGAAEIVTYSVDESPLVAAALVATAVPVNHRHTGSSAHSIRRSQHNTSYALLAGIFSGLVAFNLAFVRHLRREYASPR